MNHYKNIEILQTHESLAEMLSAFSSTKYYGILESTLYHAERGRYSILYALPIIVIRGYQTDAEILHFDLNNKLIKTERIEKDPLELIKEYYKKYNVIKYDKLPIVGGAIGYMSNDLYMDATTKKGLPSLLFGFYDTMILEDMLENKKYLISTNFSDSSPKKCQEKANQKKKIFIDYIHSKKKINFKVPEKEEINKIIVNDIKQIPKDEYVRKINTIKDLINKGEVMQVCFTYQKEMEFHNSPLFLYYLLRITNPSSFAAMMDFDDFSIISNSPERYVKLNPDNTIIWQMIKGTMKRGVTPEEDEKIKENLKTSKKDKIEHIMCLDLMRNDIGKESMIGSVEVLKYLEVIEYPNVNHLVSFLKSKGKCENQESFFNYLKSSAPAGGISGVPKRRAIEIIKNLEIGRRGIYTGSLGYLGFNNSIDFSTIVRTAIVQGNKLSAGAGGAIVYSSNPEDEYEETNIKVNFIFQAVTYLNDLIKKNKHIAYDFINECN